MRVWYHTRRGEAKAVDGVNLVIQRNEVFGIAGESGCGKSTLVKGLLRLTKLPAHIESGEAIFYRSAGNAGRMGVDLLNIDLAEMRRLRWRHLAYIPQSAMNVLNPVMRIENQMIDAILEHSEMSRSDARREIARQLEMVGLEPSVARMYPHELSGGMKQRVAIASAVTLSPELIFADEPTTALDVNVQQIILQELQDIRERLGLTLVYVTHDMAVHAELADRMGIMYAGLIVEVGSVVEVLKDPLHPYSRALVESVPTVGGERERMEGLPGRAPSPLEWPSGCRFHPRCERAMEVCREGIPPLQEVADGRMVACYLHHEG
jgi:peptide/nickel transport system ATP-binding protein